MPIIDFERGKPEECSLRGTEFCSETDMTVCKQCPVGQSKDAQQESAIENLKVLRDLLPEGVLGNLANSTDCQLCAKEPNKASLYAVVDFANAEPQTIKRSVIGTKVKSRIGSLLPVSIASCPECRRNYKLMSLIRWGSGLVTLVVLMLLLLIPGISRLVVGALDIVSVPEYSADKAGLYQPGQIVRFTEAAAEADTDDTSPGVYYVVQNANPSGEPADSQDYMLLETAMQPTDESEWPGLTGAAVYDEAQAASYQPGQVVFGAEGIPYVVQTVEPVGEPGATGDYRPLSESSSPFLWLYLIVALVLAYLMMQLAPRYLTRNMKSKTRMDVFEIPDVMRMQQMGWFLLMQDKYQTRLRFVKERPKSHFFDRLL